MSKILYFTADWCYACKNVSPMLSEYEHTKIDVDVDDNELVYKYNVKNLPTIIVVDDDGNEVRKHVGSIGKPDLEKFIKE